MKTLYVLPCPCGQSVDVDRSLAGLKVRCPCGRNLEVPTIRGLAALETRTVAETASPSTWGPRQGVIFLGLAVTIIAGLAALYLTAFPPQPPFAGANREGLAAEMAGWTPTDSFQMWNFFSQGIDRRELPQMIYYWNYMAERERWVKVVWGVAGFGVVISVLGGLLLGGPKRPPAARPKPRPATAKQ